MLKRRSDSGVATIQIGDASPAPTLPSISAEAVLSFLKDTKGTLRWSVRDLTGTLNIKRREAEQVIALFWAQGYVRPARGTDEWMTTSAGETVSGAKPPRFSRKSVEQALTALQGRIKEVNNNPRAAFRTTDAVAFGDFLVSERARVQAADIGVRLVWRDDQGSELRSATHAQAERVFLSHLRGRSGVLNIRPYAEWMRKRSHLELI
jgi:hypothetical protein